MRIVVIGGTPRYVDVPGTSLQYVENVPWIGALNAWYHLGVDGIALPLIVLTAFISPFRADRERVRGMVEQVRACERKIQNICVDRVKMPRPHFIKEFPGKECNLRWTANEVAALLRHSPGGLARATREALEEALRRYEPFKGRTVLEAIRREPDA